MDLEMALPPPAPIHLHSTSVDQSAAVHVNAYSAIRCVRIRPNSESMDARHARKLGVTIRSESRSRDLVRHHRLPPGWRRSARSPVGEAFPFHASLESWLVDTTPGAGLLRRRSQRSPSSGEVPRDLLHVIDDNLRMTKSTKHRVAVVEDDAAIGAMLDKLLTLEGFDVVVLSDGMSASAGVQRTAPDAVVLDVMLPGKDGITILRELRESPPTAHLPIVMLTAKRDDATTWQGWSAGANYFMPKPFAPDELVRVLRSIIETGGPSID